MRRVDLQNGLFKIISLHCSLEDKGLSQTQQNLNAIGFVSCVQELGVGAGKISLAFSLLTVPR